MSPVDNLRALAETFAEPGDDPALTALAELLDTLADHLAAGARTAAGHDELLLLARRLGGATTDRSPR